MKSRVRTMPVRSRTPRRFSHVRRPKWHKGKAEEPDPFGPGV
jgi:hypothetical protein